MTMTVTVNGDTYTTDATTLEALVAEYGVNGAFATALNAEFVPAVARATTTIASGDTIDIVAPMQGG